MFELHNPTVFADAGYRRLAPACALSLLFHALAFGAGARLLAAHPPPPPDPPPLHAKLVVPDPTPLPTLLAPETPPTPARAAPEIKPPPPRRPARGGFTATDVATQAMRQIAAQLYYPPEAIARGLEGETLVMLFLDEAGNALAARIERSSGHPLLDDAAVRAARAVRALPADAPQEVLLPVRFRLR